MPEMTREQIEAIERLLSWATPGPWRPRDVDVDVSLANGVCVNPTQAGRNRRAVIALVNHAPALLALAKRAIEAEARLGVHRWGTQPDIASIAFDEAEESGP